MLSFAHTWFRCGTHLMHALTGSCILLLKFCLQVSCRAYGTTPKARNEQSETKSDALFIVAKSFSILNALRTVCRSRNGFFQGRAGVYWCRSNRSLFFLHTLNAFPLTGLSTGEAAAVIADVKISSNAASGWFDHESTGMFNLTLKQRLSLMGSSTSSYPASPTKKRRFAAAVSSP